MNWNPVINKITYTDNLYEFKNSGKGIKDLPYFDQMKQLSFKTTDDICLLKIDEKGNVLLNTGVLFFGNFEYKNQLEKSIKEFELKIDKLRLKINKLESEVIEIQKKEAENNLKEELKKLGDNKIYEEKLCEKIYNNTKIYGKTKIYGD